MVARAKNEGFIYWGEQHPQTYLLAHNAVHALIANRMIGDAGFMAMWISPRKVREENWGSASISACAKAMRRRSRQWSRMASGVINDAIQRFTGVGKPVGTSLTIGSHH